MQKIELHDVITFEPSTDITLSIEGNDQLASENDNLILKAARTLRGSRDLGAKITLWKHIPTGAGLGGGSADAAATLKALNQLWDLRYSESDLQLIGIRLGADVPYCLTRFPARVSGIGEVITPFTCLREYELVLLQPSRSLSTKEIFTAYDQTEPLHPDIDAVKNALENDRYTQLPICSGNVLTAPSLQKLPEIDDYIQFLYQEGAFYAGMTGSGSVVFGAFDTTESADKAYRHLLNTCPVCIRTKTLNA